MLTALLNTTDANGKEHAPAGSPAGGEFTGKGGGMFHLTTPEIADKIRSEGFKASAVGELGPGVYVTENPSELTAKQWQSKKAFPIEIKGKLLDVGDAANRKLATLQALYGHGKGIQVYDSKVSGTPHETWWSTVHSIVEKEGYAGLRFSDYASGKNTVVFNPKNVSLASPLPNSERGAAGAILANAAQAVDVFSGAVRFPEAEQQLAQKLPTIWSEFNKANYDRSFVSAGVESARELQFWKDACTQIIEGRGNAGENRVLFNQMFQDSILNARARQDLLVSTNIEMAWGYGQMVRQLDPDLVDAYPAWELVRNDFRLHPRGDPSYKPGTDGAVDWEERWGDALAEAGSDEEKAVFENTGRMIALKDSDVWQALGDGAGGRQDTLGNPYEPFAFNSAMGREEIDRDECEGLGLLKPNEQVDPPELPGFNDSFEQDPGVDEDLLGELFELLTGIVAVKDGVLSLL